MDLKTELGTQVAALLPPKVVVMELSKKFKDFKLTVRERSEGRFKARFESKGWVREVSVTASGNSVYWKGKDVRVVQGSAGGGTTKERLSEMTGEYESTLRGVAATIRARSHSDNKIDSDCPWSIVSPSMRSMMKSSGKSCL